MMTTLIEELQATGQLRLEEKPPKDVVEALIRVIRDLPAVGKGERMAGPTGGYAFRGIEAMTAAAQPLFGKHGVLVCPEVASTTVVPIEKGGKPWVHRESKILYRLRGMNGPDDYITVGPFFAEADDNSDKSANKCMTQAYKQMLLQVLCISDRKDDPDGASLDRDGPRVEQTVDAAVAEATYVGAEKRGFSRAEIDSVASQAVGRDVVLPDVLRSEWSIVRDAWTVHLSEHERQVAEEAKQKLLAEAEQKMLAERPAAGSRVRKPKEADADPSGD
jgi:hypothetical protein